MASESDDQGNQRHTDQHPFARGVRIAIRNDASAFSYSVLVTATFAVTSMEGARVTVPRLFLFVFGATGAFAVLETIASRGFRVRLRGEPSDVVVLGTVFAPLSVGAGLAAAYAVLQVWGGNPAWVIAPLTATTVYILIAGAQMMAAQRYQAAHPPDESG